MTNICCMLVFIWNTVDYSSWKQHQPENRMIYDIAWYELNWRLHNRRHFLLHVVPSCPYTFQRNSNTCLRKEQENMDNESLSMNKTFDCFKPFSQSVTSSNLHCMWSYLTLKDMTQIITIHRVFLPKTIWTIQRSSMKQSDVL